jgi:gamma-glutamyltranspeptidase
MDILKVLEQFNKTNETHSNGTKLILELDSGYNVLSIEAQARTAPEIARVRHDLYIGDIQKSILQDVVEEHINMTLKDLDDYIRSWIKI